MVELILGFVLFQGSGYADYGKDMVNEAVRASVLMNVPIEILLAQSYEESRHSVWALGRNGKKSVDRGLMQINSRYERHFASMIEDRYGLKLEKHELRKVNFLIGAYVLRKWYDHYGSWRVALIAYNGGPGRLEKGVLVPAAVRYADRILQNSKPWGMLTVVLPSFANRVYSKEAKLPYVVMLFDLGSRFGVL